MSVCGFCGRSVLPWSSTHYGCRKAHQAGSAALLALANDWLAGQATSERVRGEVERLEREAFLNRTRRGEVLREVFERRVREALDDAVITVEEESQLGDFTDVFGVGRAELDDAGWFTRYVQTAALRDLLHGKLPQAMLPMEVDSGESVLWLFPAAQLNEGDAELRGEAPAALASVAVGGGLYVRLSEVRQKADAQRILKPVDAGALGVTNRYVHFCGRRNRFRIRLEDLGGLETTERGVRFRRPGHDKLEGFDTGDGWFLINLLNNARNARSR